MPAATAPCPHPAPSAAPAPAPVSILRPREPMLFDHVRLAAICDGYGHRAEAYLATVLGEIEAKVSAARAQADDADALRETCATVATLAQGIGMRTMEHAARGVLNGLDAGRADVTSACLGRMLRLGGPCETGGWGLHSGGPQGAA